MIRTLAVLAGGFLGFAAALMLANSTRLDPIDVSTVDDVRGYTANQSIGASFEADIRQPSGSATDGPLRDELLEREFVSQIKSDATDFDRTSRQPTVDRASDLYRIQFELARLDCFNGSIDGTWSLAFHESLSNVVLTSELDLGGSHDVGRMLFALRDLEPGICNKPRLTRDVRIDSPDETVRKDAIDAEKNIARMAGPARSSDGIGERAKSVDIIPLEIAEDNTKPTFDRQPVVPAKIDANERKTVEVLAPGSSSDKPGRVRKYVFPTLRNRHAEDVVLVAQVPTERVVDQDATELAMSQTDGLGDQADELFVEPDQQAPLGADGNTSVEIVDSNRLVEPVHVPSDLESRTAENRREVERADPIAPVASIQSGNKSDETDQRVAVRELATAVPKQSKMPFDARRTESVVESAGAVVPTAAVLIPQIEDSGLEVSGTDFAPVRAKTGSDADRIAALQTGYPSTQNNVIVEDVYDDDIGAVMPLPSRPSKALRDVFLKLERERDLNQARERRRARAQSKSRRAKRRTASLKKKAPAPKSSWKSNRKAIFAQGRN